MAKAAESTLEAPVAAAKGGRSKMLKIGGAVLVIILLEAALISFFLPGKAAKPAATPAEEAEAKPSVEADDATAVADTSEVQIGNGFSCTNSRAAAGATVHVDFKLVALVAPKNTSSFETAVKAHDARVRQAIIKVARSSSLEDLNDPNLSTIKRLIREEINKILHKSYINEVVISDFTTMEQ